MTFVDMVWRLVGHGWEREPNGVWRRYLIREQGYSLLGKWHKEKLDVIRLHYVNGNYPSCLVCLSQNVYLLPRGDEPAHKYRCKTCNAVTWVVV